jgi:AraC-like DNA-binding protein/quercetin dioxygenase-like cupin family protein
VAADMQNLTTSDVSQLSELDGRHPRVINHARIDGAKLPVGGLAVEYEPGAITPTHRHRRAQLMHVLSGTALITASAHRWLVPAEHGLWIPGGEEHSVQAIGTVRAHAIYVEPSVLQTSGRVVGLTPLMRALVTEVVSLPALEHDSPRTALLIALLLAEIPLLPELKLGLPMPDDPNLAELCRSFVVAPSPQDSIDRWAGVLAMSRRSFTRSFRRQTGLSLSAWRQQACLFAALPRLAAGEPVTAVALDLGYESPAAFTTMFKRALGLPPKRYFAA